MAVLIKRYANRKLYNTAASRYITLRGIAALLEAGEDVKVIDNETGEDMTAVTVSQILVETERWMARSLCFCRILPLILSSARILPVRAGFLPVCHPN